MATLTLINNAFDINDKEVFAIDNKFDGQPLYYALSEYIEKFKDKSYDVVFSVNGVITENLFTKINKDYHIAIVPIPAGGGGGGGKNILRIVALVALMVVAPYAAVALGVTGVAATAVTAGIMIAGGLLINSLIPVQVPSMNSSSTDLENVSTTYAFSGGSNARQEGTAIPIVLGKAKITPPVISSYLSLNGDKQYINILTAINDGKFDTVHSFSINDQDSSNFNDVYSYVKLGDNIQTPLENFSDNIVTISDGRSINVQSQEVIYTSSSNAINQLQIGLLMTKGLYLIQDSGSYSGRTISLDIYYKKVTDSEYTLFENKVITGVYKTAKRLVLNIPSLEASDYNIKIVRTSAYDTNTRVANDLQLEYVNEVTYDDLTYPNVGLLSINAMATDQLSGGFPRVSAVVENTYLRYWENDVLIEDTNKRLDNPAWATYHILRMAGFNNETIELSAFETWADYCDLKNYKCNLVLDTKMDLPDILNMISPLGRGKVIQKGVKWSVAIDKIVEMPTQSFLFTSGNIIENSFMLDYLPYTDRANVVEVTYFDEDNDYQAMTVQAQSNNFDASSDEFKTSITYYGCTNKQMAADYAQFLINNNRYITESVSFTASIESLACNVGDVIKVGKKYLTNNIEDGRIVSDTSGTIVLDNEVLLEAGKDYSIDIRKSSDDTLHTFEIVNTGNTTNTITLVNPTTTFEEFDVYSIGETGYQTNLYRVIDITRSNDFERKISAVEYVPEVYDDTLVIPDEEVKTIYNIVGLSANDNSIRNEDGTITDQLSISWQVRGFASTLPIYINDRLVGYSETNDFIWEKPDRDTNYIIKVGDASISHTYLGTLQQLDAVTNISSNFSNGVVYITWDNNRSPDFDHFELTVKGRTYKIADNSLSLIDLDIGTYEVGIYAVNTSKIKSDISTYSLVVKQPTLMFSIRDSYLIEQAFLDGLITIFTSETAPVANQKYDLWKVDINSIEVDDLTFNSAILEDVTWQEGQDYNLYKYWNGNEWVFCTPDQIAVARRMLGQLTEAGIADNEVKIFSIQPYTPYEVNDLWINGTTIKICTTTRASGSYVSTDWEDAAQESLSVSTKLENVILTS